MNILLLFLVLFQNTNQNLDKKITFHNHKADYYYHRGDYPNMLYHLIEKVKLDKHDMNSYSDIAYYYWSLSVDDKIRKEEFENKAIKYLNEGLGNNKDYAYFYDELGQFYIRKKDFKTAKKFFEQAIKRKDVPLTSFHMLSNLLLKEDNVSGAKSILKECILKFPNDNKAKSKLRELENTINY